MTLKIQSCSVIDIKTNKAPGEDITAELIKNASGELKERLHVLICKIWRDENMPDDWKVGLIVPLFKKDDKMKCENYRGITLLNVAYKILSSIILERLKEYSEEILGEYQCSFRPQRTVDQIFVVRQILEKF
jgi:sorting nexin-29